MKIQLGTGRNKLPGWLNTDRPKSGARGKEAVDITRGLPWPARSVEFILCEHTIEHVSYVAGFRLLEECYRVLKPAGVLRLIFPNPERPGINDEHVKRICTLYGHKAAWTVPIALAALRLAGFRDFAEPPYQLSEHTDLKGVDGHWRTANLEYCVLESSVIEATK